MLQSFATSFYFMSDWLTCYTLYFIQKATFVHGGFWLIKKIAVIEEGLVKYNAHRLFYAKKVIDMGPTWW